MSIAPTVERNDIDTLEIDEVHHLVQCHDDDYSRCGVDVSEDGWVDETLANCEVCLEDEANEPEDHCTCLCCFIMSAENV